MFNDDIIYMWYTYTGYVFPAVGQNSWLWRLTHGVPRITSPRISNPRATERAVHQIYKSRKENQFLHKLKDVSETSLSAKNVDDDLKMLLFNFLFFDKKSVCFSMRKMTQLIAYQPLQQIHL